MDSSTAVLDAATAELVKRLVVLYEPEQVWLFGSRARGDARDDSDWDLLIVVSDDAPPERRRARAAYKAMIDLEHGADVLVWPRSEFEARLPLRASLPRAVVDEGVLLHDAR
jgi:predicted nucleotidyltransferase